MESIKEYLKKKGYNLIDVTSSLYDVKTKTKYLNLIKEKRKTIVYIRRNEKNKKLFDPRALDTHHDMSNVIFYWMDKYFAIYLTGKEDKTILRAFDMFLEDDVMTCKVCLEKSQNIETCGECFYNICRTCLYKTDGFSKKLKCPNCREPSFMSLKNPETEIFKGKFDMKELEKMGVKPGQKVPIDKNRAVVFLTEEQMKEYGYL